MRKITKKSKKIIEISLEDKVWIKPSKKAQEKKVQGVDKRLVKMKKDYLWPIYVN